MIRRKISTVGMSLLDVHSSEYSIKNEKVHLGCAGGEVDWFSKYRTLTRRQAFVSSVKLRVKTKIRALGGYDPGRESR